MDALAYMGWREAIVALAAVLTIYVVVVFLRINRLRRERQAQPASAASRAAVAAYAEGQHPFFAPPYLGPEPVETNAARTELDEPAPEPLAAPSEAAFPWNEAPPPEAPLVETPQLAALEREVHQLRQEIIGLRSELQAWRVSQQQAEERAAPPVQMPPPISPLYSEPMQMAMHGASAGEISMHCGISRAEAELVTALARNRADG
ncbi:MAG: DUF2802 domain-containing protein [Propionivibrio sp.]